jgi:hypothetical protein
MNGIKSEFYKLRRSKAFYICLSSCTIFASVIPIVMCETPRRANREFKWAIATVVIHHDVFFDACPETTLWWNSLKSWR